MSVGDNTAQKTQLQQQITDKNNEITKCNQIKLKLSTEKGKLEGYQKTWNQQYQKHRNSKIASRVVIKNVFEGTIADELKDSYRGKVKEMKRTDLEVTNICKELDFQISKLGTHVTNLQNEITKAKTELENMEG